MLAARRVIGEARVVAPLRVPHQSGQPLPQRVVVGGDHDPLAVLRAVDVRGRDLGQERARRLAHEADLVVLDDQRLGHGEAGVGDRRVDDLARRAARVARVERHQDPLERRLRGERVAERDARARRRLVGVAVDVAEAGDRLAARGEARAVAVAAALAVARDARVDAARIDGVHLLGAEVPALHRARAEVLDDHVGARAQLGRDLLAARLAQVERDGALVAREHRPPERVVVVAQAPPLAHRVAARRRLDLDDVGAEVAEQRADERAGQELAELDRAQAGERPAGEVSRHWSPRRARPWRAGCACA